MATSKRKADKPPAKRGRPSAFKSSYVAQAAKLAQLGLTDAEIANFFGVAECTLHRWKGEFPEFCESLKAGKSIADERVERSLYARAIGYEHEEIDIRVINHQIVKTKLTKFYPPDTTAGIFWLKNRRPDKWRADNGQQNPTGPSLEDPDSDIP